MTNTPPPPARSFHLGYLIAASSGVFVGPGSFGDFHEFIEYLAGGPVWTHQMPSALDVLLPCLLAQHPWLTDITLPAFPVEGTEGAVTEWLAEQVERHGEMHQVTACESGWGREPIADLVRMVGADRVTPVVIEEKAR